MKLPDHRTHYSHKDLDPGTKQEVKEFSQLRPRKRYKGLTSPDCYIKLIRNRKIDHDPDTGEKLPIRTTTKRLMYAKAHDIDIRELHGYFVYDRNPICGSPACANPKHWRVSPDRRIGEELPRIPWWLEDELSEYQEYERDLPLNYYDPTTNKPPKDKKE